MISFGQLHRFAKQFDANRSTAYSDEMYERLVNDALADAWNITDWPFHRVEHPILLEPEYNTGTVSATNGGTKVIASSSATWSTSWPKTARMRFTASASDYLMTNFRQSGGSWVGTLDKEYAGATGGSKDYNLSFPIYELPDDFGSMDQPETPNWYRMDQISYQRWMEYRIDGVWQGPLQKYAIIPGDGITKPKLYLYPAPSIQELLRFPYIRRFDNKFYHDDGIASISASGNALRGSATNWDTTDFSLVGMVVEFPQDQRAAWGVVESVNSATGITLSGTWGGKTLSSKNYVISDRLKWPDNARSFLEASVQMKVAESRHLIQELPYYQQRRAQEMIRAKRAQARFQESLRKKAADGPEWDYWRDPPIPRLIDTAG